MSGQPLISREALTNLTDFLSKRGIADMTDTPSEILYDKPNATLKRYIPGPKRAGLPVLLVPPLGSQAKCFDLRRGCSLAEHLVENGVPTYLIDYGAPTWQDRNLGVEHYINKVVPEAVRRVSEDNNGAAVNVIGWCMGGLISIGVVAVHPELPINALAMVASPFDFSKNPLMRPLQAIGKYTGGAIVGSAIKVMGGSSAKVTELAFKATALPTYLKKPVTLWRKRDDREFLAQIGAVDELMNNMLAYPGRATLQAYQRLAMRNELASGKIQGPNKVVDLSEITIPVMNVAGSSDVIAPPAAVHHVGELLPNSPDVRLPLAPGGHLGVLTGGKAATTTWRYIDEFFADHRP
ncbi:alpha/beta fold hydrolase [Smaragdicoccus niigatensis]|uniref:alpha/beta fold hydrolase n=1 Tax=Smaragdicoccus niigatensis TaxID=359359 RepID=UPI000376A0B7|nr:alpha/beta fold hydrolase [Smaragdicoccus niigatensis]